MKKQELIDKLMIISNTGLTTSIDVNEVIKLVCDIEDENKSVALDESVINDMVDAITESIESEGLDLIDDYSLDMDYREVSLESIDLNTRSIKSAVRVAIEGVIEETKEELQVTI
jgi:hypothetical protein